MYIYYIYPTTKYAPEILYVYIPHYIKGLEIYTPHPKNGSNYVNHALLIGPRVFDENLKIETYWFSSEIIMP